MFFCLEDKNSNLLKNKFIVRLLHNDAEDPFELDKENGLMPKHSDIRFINQAGVFTIHPNHQVETSDQNTVKFIFPTKAREEIRWQLGKLGIKTSFIYPNLDGISKDILEESKTQLNGGSMRVTSPWDWA